MLSKEQLLNRKNGIGGSDVAAILCKSKWKTPLDVYLDKTNIEHNEEEKNDLFERGNDLEGFVRLLFEKKMDTKVVSNQKTIKHRKYSFLIANVDGIIQDEKAILEIKTSSTISGFGEDFTDEVPDDYWFQAMHYMNVCNLDMCYIAVLFANKQNFGLLRALVKEVGEEKAVRHCYGYDVGLDFRVFVVRRMPRLEKTIEDVLVSFWTEHVVKKIPPNPINSEDILKTKQPNEHKELICTEDIESIIQSIKKHQDDKKEKEKEIKSLQEKIKLHLGGEGRIISSGGDVLATIKACCQKRFDLEKFLEINCQLKDQIEKFKYKTNPTLVLRIL